MSYLQNNSDFSFDGRVMKIIFNNKEIYSDKMKNPMIFKITYDNNKVIGINNINI